MGGAKQAWRGREGAGVAGWKAAGTLRGGVGREVPRAETLIRAPYGRAVAATGEPDAHVLDDAGPRAHHPYSTG